MYISTGKAYSTTNYLSDSYFDKLIGGLCIFDIFLMIFTLFHFS